MDDKKSLGFCFIKADNDDWTLDLTRDKLDLLSKTK